MKNEFRLFLTALMFYTRIPCPSQVDHSDERLNQATRYFPLIGWVVGMLSFASYYALQWILPLEIAIAGSLLVGMLVTGAFHEDGLADFFDGFGGGWTREKILEIMKDSRVGTYGLVATFFSLLLKFYSLKALVEHLRPLGILWVFLLFITYHAIARGSAIQLCFLLPYVQEDALSKAKPIAKKMGKPEIIGVYLFALIPLGFLACFHPLVVAALIPLLSLIGYFKAYLHRWLGGYTGDCLGAVEQLSELVFLLSLLALWKFM